METLRFLMTSSFYPPFHLGGDAIHVKYLADELIRRGHEVHVLYSIDAFRLKHKSKARAGTTDKATTHPLKSPYGRLSPLAAYILGSSSFTERNFDRILNEAAPDVVHHHNISLLGHTLLRRRSRYMQLYTAHDYWLKCPKNDLIRKGKACDVRKCASCLLGSGRPPQLWRGRLDLRGIDTVICPSGFMAGQLKELGLNLTVIPNFSPDPPANIPGMNPGFFLYLGVIEEHKGIRILLRAFAGSDNELVIGGRGSLSGWLRKTIERDGLSDRIRFLNDVGEEKWSYLTSASAVVIPSICLENSPLVALEALSVGTPVICSDMGGTREIAERISGDLVIPACDLFGRLKDLEPPRTDRDLVKRIFRDEFSADRYIERYTAVLKGGA